MSEYTITIHQLKEAGFDFGLKDYPIWDEDYRQVLNTLLLEHFKLKEIAYQNPAYWKDRLNERINLIMRDKYNKLFEYSMLKFNPLNNIDITETYKAKNEGESSSDGGSSSNSLDSNTSTSNNEDTQIETAKGLSTTSAFPNEEMLQDELTNSVYVSDGARNQSTATNTTTNKNNVSSNATNSSELTTHGKNTNMNVQEYERKTVGSSAGLPFSKAMQQFKEYCDSYTVFSQFLNEFNDLFMTIWEEW